MSSGIKVETAGEGAIKAAIEDAGWLEGEAVLAAGQLRQGKAPSTLAMVTGAALVELLRPRRTKQLPRHFVLGVTEQRVVAFKASGGSDKEGSRYVLRIRPGVEGSWPREGVRVSSLDEGPKSKGATLHLGGESLPVARPNLTGEPSTDELLAHLSG